MKNNVSSIKTYAICLERETERRKLLTENLSSLGIEAEFVGIDGAQLPSNIAARYSESGALKYMGRVLSNAEIGCTASHSLIWEKIAAGDDEFSLILESDAVLTREVMDMIEVIRNGYSDVDLVMLSYADCVPSMWERRQLPGKYRLVRFTRKSCFSSAYLLSRKGARELIRHTQSFTMPPDELMIGGRIEKEMSIYAVYPRMVYLMEQAFDTSILRAERMVNTGSGGFSASSAEKPLRRGLPRLEQIVRHFFKGLKRPPKI